MNARAYLPNAAMTTGPLDGPDLMDEINDRIDAATVAIAERIESDRELCTQLIEDYVVAEDREGMIAPLLYALRQMIPENKYIPVDMDKLPAVAQAFKSLNAKIGEEVFRAAAEEFCRLRDNAEDARAESRMGDWS